MLSFRKNSTSVFLITLILTILARPSAFAYDFKVDNKIIKSLPFNFQLYKSKKPSRLKIHFPNLKEYPFSRDHQKLYAEEELKKGPNFSGRYRILEFGCGSECVYALMFDLSNGKKIEFPRGGEAILGMSLLFQLDSNLIIVKSYKKFIGTPVCKFEGLLFKEEKFVSLGSRFFKGEEKCSKPNVVHY